MPPDPAIVAQADQLGQGKVVVTTDPEAAVKEAQVLYTDVWASMGQESEAGDRLPIFQPYQVNDALLAKAKQRGDRAALPTRPPGRRNYP